jgi:hypothetical protein
MMADARAAPAALEGTTVHRAGAALTAQEFARAASVRALASHLEEALATRQRQAYLLGLLSGCSIQQTHNIPKQLQRLENTPHVAMLCAAVLVGCDLVAKGVLHNDNEDDDRECRQRPGLDEADEQREDGQRLKGRSPEVVELLHVNGGHAGDGWVGCAPVQWVAAAMPGRWLSAHMIQCKDGPLDSGEDAGSSTIKAGTRHTGGGGGVAGCTLAKGVA